MRKGNIFILIVTIVCLISVATFVVEFYDNNEDQDGNGYFNIYYTPKDPVEFEDVLVYADITYPDNFSPYLVHNDRKGTTSTLMGQINEITYIGQLNAEKTGREYEFWVKLIDDNTSLEKPLLSSKHFSFTVLGNIYPPILSSVERSPLHPTDNDTVTYKATMRNAKNVRYDVLLDYNVLYSNGLTKNLSFDMVRIKEGIVFSVTMDPEPENSMITYSVAVWYSFKSRVIVSSQEYMFKITK